MKYFVCLFLLYVSVASAEANSAVIREILFVGNDTTKPETMLREMSVHVGDLADPKAIEQSRQAIQDLNLFKSVQVDQKVLPNGGVRLAFIVKEKFYILPYPKLSLNDEGAYSYGVAMRLDNILGLNHSARISATRGDPKRAGYGKESNYSASYDSPFVLGTRNSLSFSAGHSNSFREDPATTNPYEEVFDNAQVVMTHTFSTTAASQGWTVGGGVLYQHENRSGLGAAPPYGNATALVGVTGYRDLHSKIYSDEGQSFGARVESAANGVGSDYSYTLFSTRYDYYLPIGDVPYQTLQLSTALGTNFNGPADVNHFSLGGTGSLYGYKRNTFDGNALYYVAAIYERPVGWNWLRATTALEVGNVSREPSSDTFGRVKASLAVGLRVRVIWFVNLEVEAGYALPLDGSTKGRAYAGRVD